MPLISNFVSNTAVDPIVNCSYSIGAASRILSLLRRTLKRASVVMLKNTLVILFLAAMTGVVAAQNYWGPFWMTEIGYGIVFADDYELDLNMQNAA